jgi:hypothetical protein
MTDAPPKRGQMIPIIVGNSCRGFIFRRRGEFEVFDIHEKSIGTFGDEYAAIAALFDPKSAQS